MLRGYSIVNGLSPEKLKEQDGQDKEKIKILYSAFSFLRKELC
jgi:hypothetical protein